ncbi:hypothetical protein BT67DRAFT_108555 [Trichocladium antarcticum]|uniref:Uncharacterized protein n=1 Tax=Trichocladium antarcticum TaxID=1450529 RepID=A0AAN6ZGV5_9PEZI|nr:hypothetical protein BT67DRAFT_108555 [Trichocladium antarcticum]
MITNLYIYTCIRTSAEIEFMRNSFSLSSFSGAPTTGPPISPQSPTTYPGTDPGRDPPERARRRFLFRHTRVSTLCCMPSITHRCISPRLLGGSLGELAPSSHHPQHVSKARGWLAWPSTSPPIPQLYTCIYKLESGGYLYSQHRARRGRDGPAKGVCP